jgi:hypothetical protein
MLKKLFVFLIILVSLFLIGKYGYKAFTNLRLNYALQQASDMPPEFWDKKYQNIPIKDKYKIVIITNNGGERSYADFFKYAAEKKGWEVQIFFYQTLGHEAEILAFDPDFILFSPYIDSRELDMQIYAHRSKKYILSLSPIQLMAGDKFKRYDPYKAIYPFDRLLSISHGVLSASKELGFYKTIFDQAKKPFNGLQILPLAPDLNNQPSEPKSLMWMSGGWDKFRSSKNYKHFINLLSENVPMKVYGHYYAASFLKSGIYDGYIPSSLEVFNTIRDNGIYLLTHSEEHIKASTPTLRIFEAAAANSVIISDNHPFVKEQFGNSVLYFDHTASSEEMYRQVKAHMDWIMANPKKAKALAAKAHQIFSEKFTLDKDLVRIAKMHEYILLQEKAMNLKYSPAY